jgi:hypothetical protein
MRRKKGRISSTKSISKSGQVSVFIIIGIIVVFVFAGILFLTQRTTQDSLQTQQTRLISLTPTVFAPIQIYTENCLEQVGIRGLKIIGEQGGYIDPELIGEFSLINPTEHDGLFLEPLQIPYWHYNAQSNDASVISFASLQPKLHDDGDNSELSIEAQLSRYVREQIQSCLQDYQIFESQGFTIEQAEIDTVNIQITPNFVSFSLEMPLEMEQGDSEGSIENFVVQIPLELERYYTLAQNITQTEQNDNFLENIGLNLVQIYSGLDQNRLPPTTATTFDKNTLIFWQVKNVKENFQSMLSSNVPLIRFASADNFRRYEYPVSDLSGLYQRTSDDLIIPLDGAQNVEVRFDYFNWDIFLDINEGETQIGSHNYEFKNPLPLIPFEFNLQNYYNTYDFSYPVLVSITDPAALNGQGYTFNFALEANVVNNRAGRGDYTEPAAVALAPSLVCDPDKRNSEVLRTLVVDSENQDPLDLVTIGFQVPNQDYCVIGTTNTRGSFEDNYPAVYGGIIDFEREGYLTSFYPIDTYLFKDEPAIIGYAIADVADPVIEMHRIKQVNVAVHEKSLEKCIDGSCPALGALGGGAESLISYKPELSNTRHSWVFSNAARPLTEQETAVLILTRISDEANPNLAQDDFATTAIIAGDTVQEIGLVPGVYEVKILLTSQLPHLIPEEERCTNGILEAISCFDIDGCCFTIDPVEMDSLQLGEIEWNTPSTYLTITPEQLYNANQITFNVLKMNLPGVPEQEHIRVIEDLNALSELKNISRDLRAELLPIYS